MSTEQQQNRSPVPAANASGEGASQGHGFYNETSVALITFGMFSALGYALGKFFGRLGDQGTETPESLKKNMIQASHRLANSEISAGQFVETAEKLSHRASYGQGEATWKWVFALVLGGTSVAVALKNLREAKQQAAQVANRAVALERAQEALSGRYAPLPDRGDSMPSAAEEDSKSPRPDRHVQEIEVSGLVQGQAGSLIPSL